MEEENNHGCLGIIISIIVLAVVIGVLSNWGKYDGESAEFWFNAYDQSEADNEALQTKFDTLSQDNEDLRSCVEDYPHDAANQCL